MDIPLTTQIVEQHAKQHADYGTDHGTDHSNSPIFHLQREISALSFCMKVELGTLNEGRIGSLRVPPSHPTTETS